MTVNHGVPGSSPGGGASLKTPSETVAFLFFFALATPWFDPDSYRGRRGSGEAEGKVSINNLRFADSKIMAVTENFKPFRSAEFLLCIWRLKHWVFCVHCRRSSHKRSLKFYNLSLVNIPENCLNLKSESKLRAFLP